MRAKLPVSIVSPIFNCAQEMPAHAAHLRRLAARVEEIIVVDSHSSDGSLEILKRGLSDLPVRWLDHPPGLYQSWNHGIEAATSEFTNIATVGDIMAPEGLSRLVGNMERFGSDVVISPPTLMRENGKEAGKQWPIHRVLGSVGMEDAVELCGADWFTLNLGFYPASLISSSASNLYRTSFLREHPFLHEYGHSGDVMWALLHAFDTTWVIDPTIESTFLLHPPGSHRKPGCRELAISKTRKIAAMLDEAEAALRGNGVPGHLIEILRRIPGRALITADTKRRYAQIKKGLIPCFIRPEAIRLKRLRNLLREEGQTAKKMICDHARSRGLGRAEAGVGEQTADGRSYLAATRS